VAIWWMFMLAGFGLSMMWPLETGYFRSRWLWREVRTAAYARLVVLTHWGVPG
jgi:hypothetical protein